MYRPAIDALYLPAGGSIEELHSGRCDTLSDGPTACQRVIDALRMGMQCSDLRGLQNTANRPNICLKGLQYCHAAEVVRE